MGDFSVADVRVQELDGHGVKIAAVYGLYDPHYAVYRTSERVSIWFADDPRVERRQRAAMAPLAPVRGEINGLVDGWRTSGDRRFRSAALRYDRRVADALVVALEGDAAAALAILGQIRDDVVAERKSRARFLYLMFAAATAAVLAVIATGVTSELGRAIFGPYGLYTVNGWTAAAAGALGAFFSIARALRSRSIHTDLQMSDNVSDAVLRILIGAIAALILQALLDAGLLSLQVGSARLGASDTLIGAATVRITPPLVLLVACFVAGFSERLVPDLLDSARFATGDPPQTAAPPARTEPAAATPLPADDAADPPEPDAPPADAAAEEAVDGCDVDAAGEDVPVTPDERLPAASGGVAPR